MTVSMTMNGAVLPIMAFTSWRRWTRGRPGAAGRHHPERHPQRVHRPQYVDHPPQFASGSSPTSSPTTAACMPNSTPSHQRLPHAGGRRDGGSRMAYTLADGLEYASHRGLKVGLTIDRFARVSRSSGLRA